MWFFIVSHAIVLDRYISSLYSPSVCYPTPFVFQQYLSRKALSTFLSKTWEIWDPTDTTLYACLSMVSTFSQNEYQIFLDLPSGPRIKTQPSRSSACVMIQQDDRNGTLTIKAAFSVSWLWQLVSQAGNLLRRMQPSHNIGVIILADVKTRHIMFKLIPQWRLQEKDWWLATRGLWRKTTILDDQGA